MLPADSYQAGLQGPSEPPQPARSPGIIAVHGDHEKITDLKDILLTMEDITAPLQARDLFGIDMPLHLEIGSGKGRFIREAALAHPRECFIGVEQAHKWARYAAERILASGISNVRIMAADALPFLQTLMPDVSVHSIHVYFPDPWPKRRHEKRRIWRSEFVEQMVRTVKPGGFIQFATDIRGYFVSIQALLSTVEKLEQISMAKEPETGYARKFLAQGRPVFVSRFVKEG